MFVCLLRLACLRVLLCRRCTGALYIVLVSRVSCIITKRRVMLVMQVLAVALGQAVYLWNAATGSIDHLLTLPEENDFVTR